MAKHVLNNNNDDLDFVLIGLMTPENQYSIVTRINTALGIELALDNHVPFNLKDGKLFYFALFNYLSEEFGLEYFLIPNNSNFDEPKIERAGGEDLFADMNVEESTKLIKELPKTDYFIILKGEGLHTAQFKIIDKLKAIKEILQVQSIEPKDLPSKMNLVF